MASQRLGPFELLRVVGRGGMGTVYEAREEGSDERVAVKALSPAFSFDEHFRNRFEAEIDALMSLDHKNIVRLLSYGQDEGNLYFAMELVDGTSLFQEQKQGQVFHWQEIVNIGIQVCEGLRHAHDRGIIHRDLKPGNLMIDADRQVKITDFGIAKSFGKSSLTSEGNVLGTMDFMAPEQARGHNTNARSDLFSLGAVMYSLLAGRPPFLKETVELTFEALLSADPPPRLDKIAPDIPQPLADLVHRLMEKDPVRRIATALATGRQLAHVRDQVKMDPKKMDTQVVGKERDVFDTANTRVVGDHATGNREFGETSEKRDSGNRLTEAEGDSVRRSSNSETQLDVGDSPARQPDYYNEVTPQQRKKKSEVLTAQQETSSPWVLLLALLLVVGMFAGGIWLANRPPGKEDLLMEIRRRENRPTKVQDQIQEFIRWYSDEPEIEYVVIMQERGDVQRYCNSLGVRRKHSTNKPLSSIETTFLDNYELSKLNIHQALDKMQSFLILTDTSSTQRTPDDSEAVSMARRVISLWKVSAEQQIKEGTQQIRDGFKEAERGGNKQNSLDIYNSIIEIFKNDEWAKEKVDEARKLKAELEKAEEPPPKSDDKEENCPA